MHYFLLGPSGVGKTWFGNWLEVDRQYHHMRVDNGVQDSKLHKEERLLELWKRGNPKIIETSPSFIDVAREAANDSADRDRARAHWFEHNRTYQRMGGPGLSSYRADTIRPSGEWLTGSEIADLLKIE